MNKEKKWYCLCVCDFDTDHIVHGPFKSYESCWDFMKQSAENHYNTSIKEENRDAYIRVDRNSGECFVTDYFDDGDDTHTTISWYAFDM